MNNYNGSCGNPPRHANNFVTHVPYDPTCPDACAKVIPFEGQGRAIQPGESACKIELQFDNRTGSTTRYAAIGASTITQDEEVFLEFLAEEGFKLPDGTVAADFFNFDDTADTLAKLNAILTFRLYELSRINITTTGSEDIQGSQFNQKLQQTIIGADPFDYCPKDISGLACSYCPDDKSVQTYNKCEIFIGKHTFLLVPVVAGALVDFEACVCGYTLTEKLTACGAPRYAAPPLPMLPFCPEVVVPVEGQQYSNGKVINGQFVPGSWVNGQFVPANGNGMNGNGNGQRFNG